MITWEKWAQADLNGATTGTYKELRQRSIRGEPVIRVILICAAIADRSHISGRLFGEWTQSRISSQRTQSITAMISAVRAGIGMTFAKHGLLKIEMFLIRIILCI